MYKPANISTETKAAIREIKQILAEHSLCQNPDIEEDIGIAVLADEEVEGLLLTSIYLGIENEVFVESAEISSDEIDIDLLDNLKPDIIEEILSYLKDNDKYIWFPDIDKFSQKALVEYYKTKNIWNLSVKEIFGQNALYLTLEDTMILFNLLVDEDNKNHIFDLPEIEDAPFNQIESLWKKFVKKNRYSATVENVKLYEFLGNNLDYTIAELANVGLKYSE